MSSPTPTPADRLLVTIRKRPDHKFDLARLAKNLKLEPDQLGWELTQLHQWGYRFKKTADTITFLSAPDLLSSVEISHGLKTKTFGRNCISYNSVKSTNDLARELAESGAPEGTLIVAEQQTKGRGRFKRTWYSPPGTGIYMSLILRPKLKPELAPALSIVTALSLAETIAHWLPERVLIKWPNDILLGRDKRQVRKAAGILTELTADRGKIDFIVVGVGINVNQTSPDFPEDIRKLATSIRRVLRKKLSRVELLQRFLLQFEKDYATYCKNGLKPMQSRLRKRSYLIGREVRIAAGNDIIEGTAIDIDRQGRLIVDTGQGNLPINAGEVTLLKQ